MASASRPAPPGFVDLAQVLPSATFDIRYATARNFTGAPLPGYESPGAWLLAPAAEALARAQAALAAQGLGLLVFDAYRPLRASEAMAAWCRAHGREELLRGWIASPSRHNRGAAVDVGLWRQGLVDLGCDFDTFDDRAHTESATGEALAGRLLLREAMVASGFKPYWREWWHFELEGVDAPVRDEGYGEPLPPAPSPSGEGERHS